MVYPTNNEYLVIDDCSGHVTSFHTHVWDWRPFISFRVVLLATARIDASVGLPSCKYIYSALSYCIQKSGKFPGNIERTIWNNKDIFVNIILYTTKSLNIKWSLSSQPTKLPTLAYFIGGQTAKQKSFHLHRAGQFLIQANSRSAGKEFSVFNWARRLFNMFTRSYHWLIFIHTVSITSILILSCRLRLKSSVCVTNVFQIILQIFMLLKCIIEFRQKILKLILV
jgi:hypothetical protein